MNYIINAILHMCVSTCLCHDRNSSISLFSSFSDFVKLSNLASFTIFTRLPFLAVYFHYGFCIKTGFEQFHQRITYQFGKICQKSFSPNNKDSYSREKSVYCRKSTRKLFKQDFLATAFNTELCNLFKLLSYSIDTDDFMCTCFSSVQN